MEKAIIRTFGRTHGKKLSKRQQWLIDNILPKLDPSKNAISKITGNILEIGFGAGEHLMELALQNPNKIIIGAEPFTNGVASLLSHITNDNGIIKKEFKNIRIFPDDIRKLLSTTINNFIFDKIFILHPDPWPKARHEKRRLLNSEFLKQISSFISKDAEIIIGTDHTDYYNWILEKIKATNLKIKTTYVDIIRTRYQEKNIFKSEKTMYLVLGI